jgi:hypothetical protein
VRLRRVVISQYISSSSRARGKRDAISGRPYESRMPGVKVVDDTERFSEPKSEYGGRTTTRYSRHKFARGHLGCPGEQ